jgi:hypothetical protein
MNQPTAYPTNGQACPHCGYSAEMIRELNGRRPPCPGSILICNNCYGWSIFTDDLSLVKPSEADRFRVEMDGKGEMIREHARTMQAVAEDRMHRGFYRPQAPPEQPLKGTT